MNPWKARLRKATSPVLQPYFQDVGTEIESLRSQLQDQVRDQLNDHLDSFRDMFRLQLQDQVRDQLNDHLESFLSRLQGQVASEVESRLLPRLGSVDAEVASLRDGTAETSSLTGALRDDVAALQSDIVELTRMLRMQADAADQVAEALGRTLIRLSVEVEDLNVALGGSPARAAELWPALGPEEEDVGAQDEARVVSLGLRSERAGGSPARPAEARVDGPPGVEERARVEGTGDADGASPRAQAGPSAKASPRAQAGPPAKASRRGTGRSRAEDQGASGAQGGGEVLRAVGAATTQDVSASPGVERNGALVPGLEEAPSRE